jgi:hypothetical protein
MYCSRVRLPSAQAGVVVFQNSKNLPMMIKKRLLCSKVLRLDLQQELRSPFCCSRSRACSRRPCPSIAHARPWVGKGDVAAPVNKKCRFGRDVRKACRCWSCAIEGLLLVGNNK